MLKGIGSGWSRIRKVKIQGTRGRGGEHRGGEGRASHPGYDQRPGRLRPAGLAGRPEIQEHQARPFVLRTYVVVRMGKGEKVTY